MNVQQVTATRWMGLLSTSTRIRALSMGNFVDDHHHHYNIWGVTDCLLIVTLSNISTIGLMATLQQGCITYETAETLQLFPMLAWSRWKQCKRAMKQTFTKHYILNLSSGTLPLRSSRLVKPLPTILIPTFF